MKHLAIIDSIRGGSSGPLHWIGLTLFIVILIIVVVQLFMRGRRR